MYNAALACTSGSFYPSNAPPKTYTFASPPRAVQATAYGPGRRKSDKNPPSVRLALVLAGLAGLASSRAPQCVLHCGPRHATMFAAKPVTIEIVASGAGPAEISLLTAGLTTAEYVGDAGAFAFQVVQEGDGKDNADAPPLNNNNNNNIVKPSNLHRVYSRSNGHLAPGALNNSKQQQLSASSGSLRNSNNKNLFLSRENDTSTTGASMTFLESLDAKLQRLHDYTGRDAGRGGERRHTRTRRAADPEQQQQQQQQCIVQHPKPFMTVVRQGTFLKPPPELAALLGLSATSSEDSSPSASGQQPLLYSFSSRPRVLHQRAKRAADNIDDGQLYSNLMHDRRVIRGNTFAQHSLSSGDAQDATAAALRQAEARRRTLARRKAQLQARGARGARGRPGTPPPVAGRQHLDVQTDRYLEEIFDKPLESEVCCQTDLFAERPATPQYVPASVGRDAETQILPGELFDFDEEVTPVLEVLVGRTVEQALVEVLEEEEVATTQRQHARLQEVRLAQLEEQARLQAQEARLRLEKERRVAEYAAARRAHLELEERVTAAALSNDYLQQLLPSVLDNLHHISDPVQDDVGKDFMPWLMTEVQEEMQKLMTSRDIISGIVRDVLETHAELKRATADSQSPTSPRPTSPTINPASKPTSPTSKPTSPTSKPTSPTSKPTSPTSKPTSPTINPTRPTSKPSTPTINPTSKPNTPTINPTSKPTSPTIKPTIKPNSHTSSNDPTTPRVIGVIEGGDAAPAVPAPAAPAAPAASHGDVSHAAPQQ